MAKGKSGGFTGKVPTKEGRGRRQTGLSLKEAQRIEEELYEFVLMGYPRSDVVEYLELNYGMHPDTAIYHFDKAQNTLLEKGDFDVDRIIIQHIAYYEEAMRFFDSIGDFIAKSKAMNAKEKLLKLFETEAQVIDVENTVNINVTETNYDITKLEPRETTELDALLKKVKKLKS